jgi:sugar/nucleoside kinase (ribokinase family)
MPLDMLTVGDATLDVFLDVDDAQVTCDIDRNNCRISFTYADKIPVTRMHKVAGAGNASNNAVGSARLGLATSISSILGEDSVGNDILAHWKEENVGTDLVVFDKERGTNYSTVINSKGERTIFVYHEHRTYVFPKDAEPSKWVYYTSMGEGSDVMHSDLIKYVRHTGAKLCFQPGTYQIKLGKTALAPLLAVTDVLAVNKEEAERILGVGTTDIKDLLTAFRRLGVKTVIITDGPMGSFTFDGETFRSLGIFDTPVVERTGVGDAFATAFVVALAKGKDVPTAMRWGTANSASVIQQIGPQAGLCHMEELEALLEEFKDHVPKEF